MIEATELIDCQPASPYCPANWRWRRAEGIRLGLLRDTRRRRDPWVGRALRFLIDRAAGRGDSSGPGSTRPDPAVLGAFRVWSSGDPGIRRELEARALAGQGLGEISARLDLAADVVVAYEQLHFDVRERRKATSYIMGTVIGHNVHDGFAVGDIEAVMKVFAFGYGPVVLDAVIEVLGVGDAAGGSPAVAVDRDLARAVRMAIAARSIPVTERTAPVLIRLNDLLIEVERRAAADTPLNAPIRATIEPWPVSATACGGGDRRVAPTVSPLDAAPEAGQDPPPAGLAERGRDADVPAEAGPGHYATTMRRSA